MQERCSNRSNSVLSVEYQKEKQIIYDNLKTYHGYISGHLLKTVIFFQSTGDILKNQYLDHTKFNTLNVYVLNIGPALS